MKFVHLKLNVLSYFSLSATDFQPVSCLTDTYGRQTVGPPAIMMSLIKSVVGLQYAASRYSSTCNCVWIS